VRLGLGLGLIALCGFLACAGDDNGEAFGEHDIEGTVQDEFTSRGVSQAKLTFVSDTLDRAETTSDQAGRFVLHVEVPEGVRFGTLEASGAGYADSAKASVYFDGSALRIDLKLRPKN
jgi:hypothetical protein